MTIWTEYKEQKILWMLTCKLATENKWASTSGPSSWIRMNLAVIILENCFVFLPLDNCPWTPLAAGWNINHISHEMSHIINDSGRSKKDIKVWRLSIKRKINFRYTAIFYNLYHIILPRTMKRIINNLHTSFACCCRWARNLQFLLSKNSNSWNKIHTWIQTEMYAIVGRRNCFSTWIKTSNLTMIWYETPDNST